MTNRMSCTEQLGFIGNKFTSFRRAATLWGGHYICGSTGKKEND